MRKETQVLYLTNIPSPYRVDFFNELGKYCDLTVLYERSNAKDRDKKWKANCPLNFKEIFLKGINIGKDTAINPWVIKYLERFKKGIIVIGGFSTPTGMLSIEYLRIRNIQFMLNADGGIVKSESRFKYFFKKHFISRASAWLSTSKITDEYFLAYGAKKDSIYRYPFTSLSEDEIMDKILSFDEKIENKKKLGINTNKVVLAVGRFIPSKKYDLLLNAWSKVNCESTLCIVGSGPEKEKYQNIINYLKLNNVKIIDFKQKNELKCYYMCADVFVHPTETDVWGLVINEAMAHGLPIITTDGCVAGLELVKNNDNGFIIPINNIDRISASVNELLNNNELKISMGQRSLEKISNYSIKNMAKVHMDIFKMVYKNRWR